MQAAVKNRGPFGSKLLPLTTERAIPLIPSAPTIKSETTVSPFCRVTEGFEESMSTTLEFGLKVTPESVASLNSQFHKSESWFKVRNENRGLQPGIGLDVPTKKYNLRCLDLGRLRVVGVHLTVMFRQGCHIQLSKAVLVCVGCTVTSVSHCACNCISKTSDCTFQVMFSNPND